MSPIHCLQFLLFSVCVNLFTLFGYSVYYSDRLYFKNQVQEEYDYIIVGSGTAGSLIAHRLAKETKHSFIVLEAGSHSHAWLEIPVLGPFLHRSVFDWQFESVPQEGACLALEDKICRLPQGKIVGGSSKINNMIHVRGNISHYVNWFHGKYTKEQIIKQFDFIEKNILQLNNIQYESQLADAVLDAAEELGHGILGTDFGEGFMKSKVSQEDGKRWSIADNLLPDHVVAHSLVENVIFNDNKAQGVNVDILGKKYRINARKGVILSAGTINTPKILQLSGIGPKDLLESFNIPVVKVLPVGKNLQDHVATGLDLILFNKSVSIDAFDMFNLANVVQYFFDGRGPLTTTGCEAIGFVSTKNDGVLDLQYMVMPVGLSSDRGSVLRKNLGVSDEVWNNYFAKSFDKYVASFLPVVLHPKSKGAVYVTSRDPEEPPIFDPQYLSDKEDVEVLINGLKILNRLIGTNALKNIGAYLNPHHFPGCEDHVIFSDPYLECYVRHLTLTSYHPVGTCSMGLPTSKNTVVDTSFKVLDIDRLFVVDASVLPTLPSGNINAAIAMMASTFFDANIDIKTTVYEDSIPFCKKYKWYDSSHNFCVVE